MRFPFIGLAIVPLAVAKSMFTNSGELAGWGFKEMKDGARVDQIKIQSEPYAKGPTALHFTLPKLGPDASFESDPKAIVGFDNGYTVGDKRSYAFSFKLAPGWDMKEEEEPVRFQLLRFNYLGDALVCHANQYSVAGLFIVGNKLQATVLAKPAKCNEVIDFKVLDIATVTAGKWYRIALHAAWQGDATGVLDVVLNGRNVLSKQQLITTMQLPGAIFKLELGLQLWRNGPRRPGQFERKEMWVDEVKIGTDLADVEPNLGQSGTPPPKTTPQTPKLPKNHRVRRSIGGVA